VQCLCGPQRHCIIALPYEPGVSTFGDQPVTEANAAHIVQRFVDVAIVAKEFNAWCGICGAKREQWVFEDMPLGFNSLEEAQPFLDEAAKQQAQTRRMFKEGKN
jgi:hypothetical protein